MPKGASRVAEYEPGRKITLENTFPQLIRGSRESFGLENVEGKTKVKIAWEVKINSFYRLVGPLLVGRLRKSNDAMVSNVKRILESQSHA